MLKLCVIGAGLHSRSYHLPALAHYKACAGDFALSAICDIDATRAALAAQQYGFERSFSRVEDMLASVRPDACMAITPVATTAAISLGLLAAGCPVLVEKPLGADIAMARDFVKRSLMAKAPAMVSMNRRFDPSTRAAIDWIGPRRINYIRGVMTRVERSEANYMYETGLHLVDVVRSIGGEVVSTASNARMVDGALWWNVRLAFKNGSHAVLEVQPTSSTNEEYLQLFGDGFAVEAHSAEFDTGAWRAWADGALVREELSKASLPPFVANGTYAETLAFLNSVRDRQPLAPSPSDVLLSMEICHHVMQGTQGGGA